MQQYVKWDHENECILFGPQQVMGDGGDWYTYVEIGEVENARTQTVSHEFIPEAQMVFRIIHGSADLTWEQSRINGYGSLAEQFDMIWHDIDNNTLDKSGQFYAFIKGVKDNNPKP